MAASLNKVMLIGNLTDDPEMKYMPSGTAMTKFRIAINRSYKDSSGETQEDVVFCPIVVWGKTAENCAQYLSKGRSVFVEGRLSIRTFDDSEGERRRYTEVVANSVQFLGSKPGGSSSAAFDEEEAPF